MSNVTTLKNHKLAGTWNGGKYTVTVTRRLEGRYFGQNQYSYHASIRRSADGAVVNVALATLRAAKIGWSGSGKEFPNHKFTNWQETAKLRGDTGAASPVSAAKAADVVSIDTDYTKTAKVTINIQKTFEGDADDVRDELYELISQLEDAIHDIEG